MKQCLYQIKKTIWNYKPIPQYILYENKKDLEKYFLVLRTYEGDDFELHRFKGIANSNKHDPFIIEDTKIKRHLFGQYQKMLKFDKLSHIIKQAHESNKGHLIRRATADYLTKNMNWYWPNVYFDWDEYVRQCIKWRMHQNPKRKRVVKYIRTKIAYEKYQIDLVELSNEFNMNKKYPCLLTSVHNFSKYAWTIPIENKKQKQFEMLSLRYWLEVILKRFKQMTGRSL